MLACKTRVEELRKRQGRGPVPPRAGCTVVAAVIADSYRFAPRFGLRPDPRGAKGQRVLLMVPESGRFTVGFALLTAVSGDSRSRVTASEASVWPRGHGSLRSRSELEPIDPVKALEASPLADAALDGRDELTRTLVLELALVWAEFERMLRSRP